VPVYAKPPDLLDANPLTGERGRGRLDENGQYVLYYERGEIDGGVLAGRGLEIAGRPIRSPSSFSRSRDRGGCACPTAA
jgi:hypothetical protein